MRIISGEKYEVVVVKIEPFGAIVQMEDESTRLIHISKIADAYISDVADYLSVGKSYQAECVETTTYGLQLSLVHLGLTSNSKTNSYSNNSNNLSNSNHKFNKRDPHGNVGNRNTRRNPYAGNANKHKASKAGYANVAADKYGAVVHTC